MKYKIIKNHIRDYRILSGMTQQELADSVGVDRLTISRVESNKHNPSYVLAYAIAHALNVYDVDDLFVLVSRGGDMS